MISKEFGSRLIVFFLVAASLVALCRIEPGFGQNANGIEVVQFPAQGVYQGLGNSFTVFLNSVPTNGDLLIAVIGVNDKMAQNTVSFLSEDGVAWARQVSSSQNGVDAEIWAGEVFSADADGTILITLTAIGGDATVLYAVADVCEYSGLATSNFTDQTSTNSAFAGLSPDTGTTPVTSQPNELWVGAIATNSYDQTNPTNGFTVFDGQDNNAKGGVAYLQNIVSTMGVANSGTTLPYSAVWSGCIATFSTVAIAPTAAPVRSPTTTPAETTTSTTETPTPTAVQTTGPAASAPTPKPTGAAPTTTPITGITPGATTTPTFNPTLSPKASWSPSAFGLVDWAIVAAVVITVAGVAFFGFYSRRGKHTTMPPDSQMALSVSVESVPEVVPDSRQTFVENVEQNNLVDEAPVEGDGGKIVVDESFTGEEGQVNVSEIAIAPKALNFLKKRSEVFALVDLKNSQYTLSKIKGFDAKVTVEFKKFVEVCKKTSAEETVAEDAPEVEFTTSTFDAASPTDSKSQDLDFYVGKSGFPTVTDWLKTVTNENAIPECSAGHLMFCLYYFRVRGIPK
jgi:hypothetical protein